MATIPEMRSELLDIIRKGLRFLDKGSPAHDALMALQAGIIIDDSPLTEADMESAKRFLAQHPEVEERAQEIQAKDHESKP